MSEISKVVLYKHGVGYFERQANVVGNSELRLSFRAEEMNDVLKSLTVFDSGGGSVTSVSYDNQKPLARLLEESSLDIPSSGGGQALMASIRGATVQVSAGNRIVIGQIVGIEERSSVQNGAVSTVGRLTVFDASGSLHGFDLPEISQVKFLDEHIVGELRFHFETLLAATQRDAKNLKLFARGEGERTLSISYVVECPVWKTSYRIALSSQDEEKPYLQGWALVDNPQDQDWKDVQLSLVSGLPISFVHDLYSPRYLKRREILVEREAAAGPVMTEGDLFGAFGGEGALKECFAADSSESVCPAPMAFAPPAPPPPPSRAAKMASSHQVETVAQSVGQLFEYRIDKPVTVERNQSALVPIVGGPCEGRRKILYNRIHRADAPFAIVDFKNTTGLTLEGGPVTVFEDDVYAGEAMLDTLAPDEQRMLAYAVDLSVECRAQDQESEHVTLERLIDGLWTQRKARFQTTRYTFANNSHLSKELVLEQSITPGELVRTAAPVSESRNFWRFALTLPPKETTEFHVTVKSDEQYQQSLLNADPQWIATTLRYTRVSDALSELLATVEEFAQKLQEVNQEDHKLELRTQEIHREQGRLRENLAKLSQSADEARLRSRYVGQLEVQEDELAGIAQKRQELAHSRDRHHHALQDLLRKFSFEQAFETEQR